MLSIVLFQSSFPGFQHQIPYHAKEIIKKNGLIQESGVMAFSTPGAGPR